MRHLQLQPRDYQNPDPCTLKKNLESEFNQAKSPTLQKTGGASRAYRSLGEVAKILGISRQAVQQCERSAFHKIRVALLAELRESNPELADNFK
jgi:DNA-directed RNA polymerase sigma subunit (sigma70/sigma32)